MLTWFVIFALIWPLWWLLRVLLVTRVLLGLELHRGNVHPLEREQLPPHVREAGQPLIGQCESLGFRLLGGWVVQHGEDRARDEYTIALVHGEHPVRAIIKARAEAAYAGVCYASLRTTSAAGHEIVTTAYLPDEVLPSPPALEVEKIDGGAPAALWERHLTRIAPMAATVWRGTDLAGAAAREQSICDGIFAHLCGSGLVAERGNGAVSLRFWPAVVRAARALQRLGRNKRAQRGKPAEPPPLLSEESQLAFDLQHYRQLKALTRGRFTLKMKATMTLVSFLLFAGLLAWRYSPAIAITLVAALVFHEGGHLVGMWWFGYRDTQLLFVPFFGGAAIGHDDKVLPPWQHVVIILLGPLPGIFVGLLLLIYAAGGGPPWLMQAAVTTLVLNIFNLIPIMPLDGGQIVDFAVAARFPRARVLFLGLSALGLLGVSLLLDGMKLLLFLSIVMLIRLPIEWRLARIRREIREEFPDGGDEEPIVRRLLLRFREPQWSKTPRAQRLQLARGLQQVLRTPRPRFGTVCLALAGYTAPLWIGIPVALWATAQRGGAETRAVEASAAEQGMVTAASAATAVPAEENGALLYAQAEALDAKTDDKAAAARNPEVLALLRAAAQKPHFVPPPIPAGESKSRWVARSQNGHLIRELISAADERLRYREPDAAVSLCLDALRLVRLADSAPGWMSWSTHERVTEQAWNGLEEAVAGGARLTAAQVAELGGCIDEKREIALATECIPRELVEQARFMEEALARSKASFGTRMLMRLLSSGTGDAKAGLMEQAVVARATLAEVSAGRWPKPERLNEETMVKRTSQMRSQMLVAQLADLLARMRQARAALTLIDQRQHGKPVRSIADLPGSVAQLTHPSTHEPLRWMRRGSIDVLLFTRAAAQMFGPEYPDRELVWRLPAP